MKAYSAHFYRIQLILHVQVFRCLLPGYLRLSCFDLKFMKLMPCVDSLNNCFALNSETVPRQPPFPAEKSFLQSRNPDTVGNPDTISSVTQSRQDTPQRRASFTTLFECMNHAQSPVALSFNSMKKLPALLNKHTQTLDLLAVRHHSICLGTCITLPTSSATSSSHFARGSASV